MRTPKGWFVASWTPDGPATLFVGRPAADGAVELAAWGEGAAWAIDQAPSLLGAADSVPEGPWHPHPVVDAARRAVPHLRIGRSELLVQMAVPTVIEQKVTGQEAFGSYGDLVRRFGSPAPGPAGERSLMVPPSDGAWAALPSWEWIRAGVDHHRAAAITQVLHHAPALARAVERAPADAERLLRTLPGIGVWTAAEIRARTWGDPDAVSFGDYHVAADVGVAVTGAAFDDHALEGFLEPWRGQRGRVVQWILRYRGGRPRHGPRMAPRRHLP